MRQTFMPEYKPKRSFDRLLCGEYQRNRGQRYFAPLGHLADGAYARKAED